MPLATVNDVPIIRGNVRLQRSGLWIADLAVDQRAAISGGVKIRTGPLELGGFAVQDRSGVFVDTAILRVIAGAGGMGKEVPAKFYRLIPARQVVQDILRAAGETLSASSDGLLLGRQLAAYCQLRQPAGMALQTIVDKLGALWRALPDGSIWIGLETWPAAKSPGESLRRDPHERSEVWGVEAPGLFPGTALDGQKVSVVEHQISDGEIRTVVWYEAGDVADDAEDRRTRAVRAVVEHLTAPLDFHAIYRAKVVSQNADGTLDLQLENDRFPGMSKVPIRLGLPGVTVEVVGGARVDVAFEDGDPSQPIASLWEPGSLSKIKIVASTKVEVSAPEIDVGGDGTIVNVGGTGAQVNLGGSVLGVARLGDTVQAGPFPGTITKGSTTVKTGAS